MSKTNMNYKKSVKMLRKPLLVNEKKVVKHGSYYKELNCEEEEEEVGEDFMEELKEKDCSSFNRLPEEMINIILEYLPYNIRLAILKHKYNKNFIRSMLKKMPLTFDGLTRLFKCADIASQLLDMIISYRSKIFENLTPGSVICFKHEKSPEEYSRWYSEQFTKIILAALKHYTLIYRADTSKRIKRRIQYIEQIMLHILAHLAAMK